MSRTSSESFLNFARFDISAPLLKHTLFLQWILSLQINLAATLQF